MDQVLTVRRREADCVAGRAENHGHGEAAFVSIVVVISINLSATTRESCARPQDPCPSTRRASRECSPLTGEESGQKPGFLPPSVPQKSCRCSSPSSAPTSCRSAARMRICWRSRGRPSASACALAHLSRSSPARASTSRACAAHPLRIFHALHARDAPPPPSPSPTCSGSPASAAGSACRSTSAAASSGWRSPAATSRRWRGSRRAGCVAGEDAVSAAANAWRVDMLEVLHALGARGDSSASSRGARQAHRRARRVPAAR